MKMQRHSWHGRKPWRTAISSGGALHSLAYSPCPNDTFMFHALATGRVLVPGVSFRISLHDVERLNRMALHGEADVLKVSAATYLRVRDRYSLLSAGSAMGYGYGPVVVQRAGKPPVDPAKCRVAVPGELTTGNLLLSLWKPHAANRVFVRYDRVIPMVASGEVDCGVVIHEGRFTYRKSGLKLVKDLGQWWERKTGLPLPLGCVVAKKSLGPHVIAAIDRALRESIAVAMRNPTGPLHYMRQHAQEMDDAVMAEHVRTFVGDFSLSQGDIGKAAMRALDCLFRCRT